MRPVYINVPTGVHARSLNLTLHSPQDLELSMDSLEIHLERMYARNDNIAGMLRKVDNISWLLAFKAKGDLRSVDQKGAF